MSLVLRDQVMQLVKNGATFMGAYYDGIGVLMQLKRNFCCDPLYKRLDQHAFTLASFVEKHGERQRLISDIKAELDLMRTDAVAGKLEPKHRVVWVVNIWCLLKLQALQNDDRNGLQFAGNHLSAL